MTSFLAQRPISERSFERLYRAHAQDVYRYSLMLLRNRADAEDAAQTTFMKAYRAILRGDRPRHPRRWLITIAHNTCRTRVRDRSRRPQEVAFDETLAEPSMAAEEPDVDVDQLVHALAALSDNQRAALVLRELEGRSYTEIARTLHLSASAVETLLFRARRALREQLEGTLTCGEAEHALSLQLDGRLGGEAHRHLRAHLRECGECASLARRQRARRAALRGLGPLPLPASLASGSGIGTGSGIAVKVAALLAAGVAATGVQSGDEAVATAPERAPASNVPVATAPPTPAASHVATAPRGRAEAAVPRSQLRPRTILADAAAPTAASVHAPAPRSPAPQSAPAPDSPAPPLLSAVEPEVTLTAGKTTVASPSVTVTAPLPVEIQLPPPPQLSPPPLPTLP